MNILNYNKFLSKILEKKSPIDDLLDIIDDKITKLSYNYVKHNKEIKRKIKVGGVYKYSDGITEQQEHVMITDMHDESGIVFIYIFSDKKETTKMIDEFFDVREDEDNLISFLNMDTIKSHVQKHPELLKHVLYAIDVFQKLVIDKKKVKIKNTQDINKIRDIYNNLNKSEEPVEKPSEKPVDVTKISIGDVYNYNDKNVTIVRYEDKDGNYILGVDNAVNVIFEDESDNEYKVELNKFLKKSKFVKKIEQK